MVVTSVDRDDLDDGGAAHFAAVIASIRAASPATTIEILTPDFLRKPGALERRGRGPAGRVQPQSRDGAVKLSDGAARAPAISIRLRLLQRVKELDAGIFTKSGIMVGLGEERNEVLQLMDDLRSAEVDFLTIGQYLQPTRKHHPVMAFVPPDVVQGL